MEPAVPAPPGGAVAAQRRAARPLASGAAPPGCGAPAGSAWSTWRARRMRAVGRSLSVRRHRGRRMPGLGDPLRVGHVGGDHRESRAANP